jgi:DcuC family C4-dicarboxylate transporter
MSRIKPFSIMVWGLIGALSSILEASLPAGSGVFSFENPRNGKTVTVYYAKAAHYDPSHPPVIVLHGMNRNPKTYRDGWVELAEQHGFLVIAPYFSKEEYPGTAGYNLGNIFPEEEDLSSRKPESEWSFRVPDDVFEYLETTGETTSGGYFAFGHSAGSQFLHRKMAMAPDPRMLLAVAANAGWYTLPEVETTWPYGLAGTDFNESRLPDYLSTHLLVLLGNQDTDVTSDSLRKTPEANGQGAHRFARGHHFFHTGKSLAQSMDTGFNWRLQVVPGVAHEGQRMAIPAAEYMARHMPEKASAGGTLMRFCAILIIAFTVVLIVRQYQTHATLFLSGFALLTLAWAYSRISGTSFSPYEQSPTGWFGFDLFAIVKESFSTRLAKIGLIIMAAGGFAKYMSSIHASTALVKLAVKPLQKLKNPYILLALAYVVGQILNIFVPSAAGLAMLLLVAMYPTLIQLGLRPAAVAAVIGTTACLDLGPASGASNVAANVSGLKPVVYFVSHQLPVALIVIPVIALLHFFWQRFCDQMEPVQDESELEPLQEDIPIVAVPALYAALPVLPLILLLVFSPLVVQSIQVDVVTAMLIGLFAGITCEAIRLRSLKMALAGIVQFFKGMGDILAKVVTLIVAAETFATGVKATGLIDSMIQLVQGAGMGSTAMVIALVFLIGFTSIVTGSGNAALFSFANMIPGIAKPMGVSTVALMLPSQLAAGLFRSMSPVAGVIIAVASSANVSPFAIVKRTSVPMIGGVLVMLLIGAL